MRKNYRQENNKKSSYYSKNKKGDNSVLVDTDAPKQYKRLGKNRRDQHADLRKQQEELLKAQKPKFNRDQAGMWTKSEDIDANDRLEGRNPVLEALRAGRPMNKIVIAKGEREGTIKMICAIAKERDIPVQEIDKEKLDSMSFTHSHQGVIAFISAARYVEVEDILNKARGRQEQPFVLVLDEITDPQNLGAIIRTADAAGCHGVIIPKRRAVGLTAVVAKASAGAVEYVPVARVSNIGQTLDYLKKEGLWVIGTDGSGEQTHFDTDLTGPIALVIGSEGEGMGRLVKEKCDLVVRIPMKGKVTSLNASAATALVVYEIVRQRSL